MLGWDLILGTKVGQDPFGYKGFKVHMREGLVELVPCPNLHLLSLNFTHFQARWIFCYGFKGDLSGSGSGGGVDWFF